MVYETAISFGIVLTAFIFIYISTKIGKKDNQDFAPLQSLFLLIGIFILFSHLGILGIIATANSQTEIRTIINSIQAVVMYSGIFLLFYFLLMVVKNMVMDFGKRFSKEGKRERKEKKHREKEEDMM